MQLTGRQIIEEGIITGYCKEGIQQAGVDLRLMQVNSLSEEGVIPKEGKTNLPEYWEIKDRYPNSEQNRSYAIYGGPCGEILSAWHLMPGYYEIILEEGCKMPNNRAMTFVQRSSLLRCGCIIRSSQFDPGFETKHMGTFMQVFRPVTIEKGARVCQTLVMETAEVAKEDLYQGQFNHDSQRTGLFDVREIGGAQVLGGPNTCL